MNKTLKSLFNLSLAAVVAFGIGHASQAATITQTLSGFIGNTGNASDAWGPYYTEAYFSAIPPNTLPVFTIGTFSFVIPTGEQVISAQLFGNWGDEAPPYTSAHNILDLDSVIVANSHDYSPDPFGVEYTSWSYTFGSNELSIFSDGSATLTATQDSPYRVILGPTTLRLETAPSPVPEPSSMLLGLMGLGSALGFRRKKSA